jgi:hypothetical protein
MEAARAFRAWSVVEPMSARFVSSMGSAMVNIIVKSKSKRVKKAPPLSEMTRSLGQVFTS